MVESKYLVFVELPIPVGRKTKIVRVDNRNGEFPLGQIEWFSHWRQYVWHPEPLTVFNSECMQAIADKCAEMTREHRANLG